MTLFSYCKEWIVHIFLLLHVFASLLPTFIIILRIKIEENIEEHVCDVNMDDYNIYRAVRIQIMYII